MENRIILVTGGNRGIGLEICRQLAEQGHTVILGSRILDNGKSAAASLTGNVIPKKLEAKSEKDLQQLVKEIESEYGKLDVLINNAGVFSEPNVLDVSTEEMQRLFNNNVFAPLRVAQLMTPLLKKSNDPRIINMSSAMGNLESQRADHSAYRLSKFSLNGLTLQLADQLSDMTVVAMHPGWVRTDMGGEQAPLSVSEGADTAVWLATASNIPTRKFFGERTIKNW